MRCLQGIVTQEKQLKCSYPILPAVLYVAGIVNGQNKSFKDKNQLFFSGFFYYCKLFVLYQGFCLFSGYEIKNCCVD